MKSRFEDNPNGGAQSSEAIKGNIEHTRERMDQTLDQIGERLTPRHLLDEVLNYFRSHGPSRDQIKGKAYVVKDKANMAVGKAGEAAGQAMHAFTDAVRNYPVPTLLIGAGIAWAIYDRNKEENEMYYEIEEDEEFYGETGDIYTQSAVGEKSTKEKLSEKFSGTTEQMKEKGRQMKQRAAEKGRVIRIKASELRHRMSERAQETGRQVADVSNEHPLSAGIACLAAGLLIGLAVPTTRAEDEFVGRKSDQLKSRAKQKGRELMDQGKKVVSSAAEAAKDTAEREGLTPEALKQKAQHVVSETKGAAEQSMHKEGLSPSELSAKASEVGQQAKLAAKQTTSTGGKPSTP